MNSSTIEYVANLQREIKQLKTELQVAFSDAQAFEYYYRQKDKDILLLKNMVANLKARLGES